MSNATPTKPVRNRVRKRNSELAASDFCRLCKIRFTHAYGNFTTKEKSALPISTENMFEKKDSTKRTLSTYIEDDIGCV